ncbi:hypothetical protein ACRDU6_21085 [Mycolicibacterium sp. ELW1]|uniref:hypothetical protein n=1 Tax=Mycobacteriaceae TaxID=1762 RepID=UPI0011EDFAAE|nr:hypothetical protein [Mycobacterium sp. ELW1]QEN14836.1 hypothetical protein D3H54_17625 [Mycobacterium sp. ELW1]
MNPADEFLPDDRLIAVAMPEVRTNVGQFWESVFLAARHLPEGEVNPVEVEELRSDDRLIAVVTRSIQGGANEARTRELVGRKMGQVWALKDGWRGPGSLAPSKVARDFYLSVVQVLPGRLLGPAQPTPTADGGIHMEWRRGDYDYEAEITCDGELILTVLGPDDDDETVIQSPTTADLVEFVCHGA